ncbi:thioredoxin family protein [Granulicella sibirica]|uniref:Putative thiol-disulfide isomerase and thioredoxin n=1 Tax=Granulicella sibirica TaxID=2479048 RepID=A0A4Q0T5T4_9BACT|nr:thioredoxin family protein [Granulicella sibirica]RXH57369.1 putative thiol-disulfide isomerase and thioredoxin [Granulicella sibirica]
MARPTKPPVPPIRNRGPVLVVAILGVAIIVTGGVFFYLHTTEKPAAETTESSPVAAVQPEVTTPHAIPKNHIYSVTADPKVEIAAALTQAKKENKRVILDFGGDWCGDCQVLDLYFHQAPNSGLLAQNFVVVHIYIGEDGQMDQHLDVAQKYEVPISKGVPALAVLNADGKLVYAQRSGEFEAMRRMDPASVSEFLNRWKA